LRTVALTALATILALVTPTPGHAAGWSVPSIISGTEPSTNRYGPQSRFAANDAGDAVIAWRGTVAGSNRIMAATRQSGGAWSAPRSLGALESKYVYGEPDVAIGDTGVAVVSWSPSYDDNVAAAAFTPNNGWGSTELFPGAHSSTALPVVTSTGTAVVPFEMTDPDYRGGIAAATKPANGSWSTTEIAAEDSNEGITRLIALPDGRAVAAWSDLRPGDGKLHLHDVNASVLDGDLWSDVVTLASGNVLLEGVTVSTDGEAVAAFQRWSGNASFYSALPEAAFSRRLDTNNVWAPEVLIGSTTNVERYEKVLFDSQGTQISGVRSTANSGTGFGVALKKSGEPSWDATKWLATPGTNVGSAELQPVGTGGFVAAWIERQNAIGTLKASRLTPGADWSTPVVLSSAGANPIDVELDSNWFGDVIAAWSGGRTGNPAEAAVLSPSGAWTPASRLNVATNNSYVFGASIDASRRAEALWDEGVYSEDAATATLLASELFLPAPPSTPVPTPRPVRVPIPAPVRTPRPTRTPQPTRTPTPSFDVVPTSYPAPTAAPRVVTPTTKPTPRPLQTTLFIKGKVSFESKPVKPSKAGKCPKTATVSIASGKSKVTKKLKLSKAGKECRLTASIKLTGKLAKAPTITVRIAGTGLKSSKQTIKAA
jgi:hypothetical protein